MRSRATDLTAQRPPPVWGLVLAGGTSRRMGMDKGRLCVHAGLPQVRWAWSLLAQVCVRAVVSARAVQRVEEPYAGLPVVADGAGPAGPGAGLAAAWSVFPHVAWLVLAVDMPHVTAMMLRRLLDARDPAMLATAFRHADGTPEPLCTIWEPGACAVMGAARPGSRSVSLRRMLEAGPARSLDLPAPERLRSLNYPDDLGHPDSGGWSNRDGWLGQRA